MLRSFSQQDSGIFLKMNFSNGLHDGAQQILRLPLPTIPISNMSRKTSTSSISSSKNHSGGSTESIGDGTSEDGKIMRMGQMMDFWTAASLNADGIPDNYFEEPNLNAKNSSNWTPLMYAAYLGHRELCQLLILKGARVEDANEQNQTTLMLASSCGAIDVIRILMDFGADCNRRDKYGRSSLHYAVKYYHAPIVQLLLECNADPNLPDYNDSTPVLAACENGDEKILSYLLEYKGDPYRKNKQGNDAFALAVDEKLQMLLRRYNKQQEAAIMAEPALMEALCQLGLQKYVRNLTDNGIRTLDALCRLSEKDLVNLGLGLMGPKTKLINYIREICDRRRAANPAMAADTNRSRVPSDAVRMQRQQQLPPAPMAAGNEVSPSPPIVQANRQVVQPSSASAMPLTPSSSHAQQKLEELLKLAGEQRLLNAQCRKALSQVLTNGRCSTCAERAPRRGSIEELIRELDRMNARFGSFFF